MYARKKKNKSGSISVQIIDKSNGKYKVVQTVGSSSDPEKIQILWTKAKSISATPTNQLSLDFITAKDKTIINFLKDTSNLSILQTGPEKILGKIFDNIGFNVIQDELFRHITLARLVYPVSKVKTADYLERYMGISIDVSSIYRFLDRLNKKYKKQIEKIAYKQTKKSLNGSINVVFYDMTTIYFEAEDEDDLRKIGYSKDGKFQQPQIMLGLLVGENGYPIGYDIFEGNTFEGHTLIPTIEKIQKKYKFEKPIIIADAGLLSNDNISELEKQKYKYILGGRIKNESIKIKEEILIKSRNMKDGDSFEINKKQNEIKIIVSYADNRAKKDKHNRDKGIKKLGNQIASGKLTKTAINSRGYNKFLALHGDVEVVIDKLKIEEDKKWDGLKGYITNTELKPKEVIGAYGNLWQIEKAFRISKTDLRIMPIYHYRRKRIEAHICISFVAYTIYKELERLLIKYNAGFSAARAIELMQTIYELFYTLPESREQGSVMLNLREEQKILFEIIGKHEIK